MTDQVAPFVLTETTPEGVTTLTLNAPAARNALSYEMRLALLAALRTEATNTATRVLILTGAGKGFCAGGDISAMGKDPYLSIARLKLLHDIARELATFPKPVIGAINGAAFGAGFSLALLCDRVLAAPDAKFGATFGKMGLAPDTGFLWAVQRRVAQARALQIVLQTEVFGAEEALAEGLVDVIADDVLEIARAEANALLNTGLLAYGCAKRALYEMNGGLEAALSHELRDQSRLYFSEDHLEAVAAFREKRSPVFKGK